MKALNDDAEQQIEQTGNVETEEVENEGEGQSEANPGQSDEVEPGLDEEDARIHKPLPVKKQKTR